MKMVDSAFRMITSVAVKLPERKEETVAEEWMILHWNTGSVPWTHNSLHYRG